MLAPIFVVLAIASAALVGCSCTVPGESGDNLNGLEKREPAVTVDGKDAADPTVMQYEASDAVLIWKAGNDGGIEGGGGTPPTVNHDQEYYVTEIATYHSGYGPDAPVSLGNHLAQGRGRHGLWPVGDDRSQQGVLDRGTQ